MPILVRQGPVTPVPRLFKIYADAAAQPIVVSENACHRRRHVVKENAQPCSFFEQGAQITDRRVTESQPVSFFLCHVFSQLLRTDVRRRQRILLRIIAWQCHRANPLQIKIILGPGFQLVRNAQELILRKRRLQSAIWQSSTELGRQGLCKGALFDKPGHASAVATGECQKPLGRYSALPFLNCDHGGSSVPESICNLFLRKTTSPASIPQALANNLGVKFFQNVFRHLMIKYFVKLPLGAGQGRRDH